MSTKYYVDASGNYLGGFADILDKKGKVLHETGAIPERAIEVLSPPDHGLQIYDLINNKWIPLDLSKLP